VRSVSLRQIAGEINGTFRGAGRLTVRGVATDSRDINGRDLFVALKGYRFDGHSFLEDAKRAGAKAAIVSRRNPFLVKFRKDNPDFPLVEVTDTLRALGDLAGFVRDGLEIDVVGITGTTGKTCSKDYLVSILSEKHRVAASPGSYNNEVGVPITIFSIKGGDQALIVEMGARHQGDITRLAEIVKPRFGIVTNVGPGHLEFFKTEEEVARTKAELARALPSDGTLVLNADDTWSRWIARQSKARVVRFGLGRGADFKAVHIKLDPWGRPEFELRGPDLKTGIKLAGAGKHQVANALAATACAYAIGADVEDITRGLATAVLSPQRMDVVEANGYIIIDDSYNSNPRSLAAALETLKAMGSGRRTIAVLGRMAELGKNSRSYHEEAGRNAVAQDVDLLVAVGKIARSYTTAALEAGMPRGSVFRCDGTDGAASLLKAIVEPGDVILVKASRVVGLDTLAAGLRDPGFTSQKLVANV
jgi:UDP-N-acetylmuramoyl-tripeptide--D-alanyl-D-alanine ligase